MDVHPPKNGIFIGIDPYPHGKIVYMTTFDHRRVPRRWPWLISSVKLGQLRTKPPLKFNKKNKNQKPDSQTMVINYGY